LKHEIKRFSNQVSHWLVSASMRSFELVMISSFFNVDSLGLTLFRFAANTRARYCAEIQAAR
jgi:hypothetical protein